MEMPEDTINAGNYTPITQGLREHLKVTAAMLGHEPSTPLAKGVLAECDNIDALHEALEDENAELRKELKEWSTVGATAALAFVDRLSDAADRREDVDLWGARYTALPPGADGASLGIGDEVDSDVYVGGTVTAVRWDKTPNGIRALIAVRPDGWDTATWHCPEDFRRRHHIEPTVEDVLREFYVLAVRGKEAHAEDVDEDVLAEYAAKLRLAGDAE